MSTVQMIKTDAGEVMHLFEVMARHGATCSLQMNADNAADPLLSLSATKVSVDYLEGADGDTFILHLDEAEFGFELGKHTFSKYVSDTQIDVCIDGNGCTFWFSSNGMSSKAIEEANNYDETGGEFEDKEVVLNVANSVEFDEELKFLHNLISEGRFIKNVETNANGQVITVGFIEPTDSFRITTIDNYELALLTVVRGLSHENILDITELLAHAADNTDIFNKPLSDPKELATKYRVLSEVLSHANAEYREYWSVNEEASLR